MSAAPGSPAGGGGRDDFDWRQFARATVHAIEFGDDAAEVTERRVTAVEECIAARWPRRWLLLRRLRRELRASVSGYPAEMFTRGDFAERRSQWAGDMAIDIRAARRRPS